MAVIVAGVLVVTSLVFSAGSAQAGTPQYRIRALHSQKVLQVDCVVSGCWVWQVPDTGIKAGSRWYVHSVFGGFERYQLASSQILDVDGQWVSGCLDLAVGGSNPQINTPLQLRKCSSSRSQEWGWKHAFSEYYRINNRQYKDRYWAVQGASHGDAPVVQWPAPGGTHHLFRWERV